MDLKERAIYQLPNGRELVAGVTRENKAVLFNLNASEPGQYELNSEGRLLLNGQLTAWEMDDLRDTGRIAFGSRMMVEHFVDNESKGFRERSPSQMDRELLATNRT